MKVLTSIQVIVGPDGQPAFVAIPYLDYLAIRTDDSGTVPHDVVSHTVDGATPARAWREHLGLTQADVAARLGISQSAYAQQEARERLRKSSREKIAGALAIKPEQLDF
ncbi:helix-turn-helix domain-containing protein [Pararobbsia alpina]|uniref:HTH cro/C1-type domain-containing protein n=1 Tax=Pararobbsia alpina TaxID=621374 RepID=A0A6S7B842_9BURK|nr:helix-turn-helix transcriptional regulator [Pararobbsia alpina]CAB3790514.1 hypothetical protein LMG28138_03003 [Pararobbsia alpina]